MESSDLRSSSDRQGSRGTRARRIGLFGGSFDPVHHGHLHAARAAQEAFGLDRIVFMPARRPPHKPGRRLAGGQDRVALLQRALAGARRADSLARTWSVSSLELRREGPSYTVDTLRELRQAIGEAQETEIYMILGSDNLAGLPDWRDVEELLALAQPVVIFREGADVQALEALAGQLSEGAMLRLRAGYLSLAPVVASSTDLRQRLAGGADRAEVLDELPAKLREYIEARDLYRER